MDLAKNQVRDPDFLAPGAKKSGSRRPENPPSRGGFPAPRGVPPPGGRPPPGGGVGSRGPAPRPWGPGGAGPGVRPPGPGGPGVTDPRGQDPRSAGPGPKFLSKFFYARILKEICSDKKYFFLEIFFVLSYFSLCRPYLDRSTIGKKS